MPVIDMPPTDGQQSPQIDPRLLELLVCPLTKTTLAYDAARQELISRAARLAFPIIDGMPILVIAEARQLEDGDPALRRA
jgi:uncharacterized protein